MELKSVEDTSWLQLFIKNTVASPSSLRPTLAFGANPYTMPAYLIPKLRYQFAEFLGPASLNRLRILSLST